MDDFFDDTVWIFWLWFVVRILYCVFYDDTVWILFFGLLL